VRSDARRNCIAMLLVKFLTAARSRDCPLAQIQHGHGDDFGAA